MGVESRLAPQSIDWGAVELETRCARCNGEGSVNGRDPCEKCEGCGQETTEFGSKVLSLIRNHFAAMLRDLDS